jgi:hypothetical protein
VQSAVEEFGFPQGHLGHLTQQQEEAFKNFKLYCAEKGYYTPADGDKEASHDDPLLLYVCAIQPAIHLLTIQGDTSARGASSS